MKYLPGLAAQQRQGDKVCQYKTYVRAPDTGRASPSLSFSMSKCRMILRVSTDTRCITCSDMCLARKAGAATHVCTSLDGCYGVLVSPWHTSQPASIGRAGVM